VGGGLFPNISAPFASKAALMSEADFPAARPSAIIPPIDVPERRLKLCAIGR